MFRTIIFFTCIVFPFGLAQTATIYVPDDYTTIQGAIDASINGDKIIVRPGSYAENIDFIGKAITVQSERGSFSTIIDGNQAGSVVAFVSNEGTDSVLDGFTLTNGSGSPIGYNLGGGIYCYSSSPTVTNNNIVFNTANYGGGICCWLNSDPMILNNNILENTAYFFDGGGIYSIHSEPTIKNNTIVNNSAVFGGGIAIDRCSTDVTNNIIRANGAIEAGGGIICYESTNTITGNIISGNMAETGGGISIYYHSSVTIRGNTMMDNTADLCGGGIHCFYYSSGDVSNTVIWNNSSPAGPEISIDTDFRPSTLSIDYSDVKGGQSSVHVDPNCTLNWGSGMIDADPLFVDSANNDFHLTWNSPCRNTGDNSNVTEPTDFEGDPRIAIGTVDMGADEFYYHLYHTGDVVPGSPIEIKVVGYPTAPITLYLGSGIANPPYSTQHGDFWLNWPPLWQGKIGTAPGNGVLVFSATVPSNWATGDDHPLQALVGPWNGPWTWLTNLEVLTVE